MLLQKTDIDGSASQVNSHGHHHREATSPREEVVLCPVFHFAEPKRAIQNLQARFPHVRFIWHTFTDRSSVHRDGAIPEADYRAATIYLTLNHSPSSLDLLPNLRFVQLLTSGHDHLRGTPLLSDPSIPVATCAGVSARSIAQYVVLQVLSWAHQYPRVLKVMEERKWAGPERDGRGYPMANVLAGRRVGIWGYGSIGRQTARILHAMGMHIIACTSSEKPTPASRRLDTPPALARDPAMGDDEGKLPTEWHSGGTRAGLHRFLAADLDILAVFTPLTPATRRSLGREELDLLAGGRARGGGGGGHRGPAPFLVNVSRGPIAVQEELVAALEDGRLSGAALDVTDPEPLPSDHRLWALPNVSVTPHMSWCFEEYVGDCIEGVLAENLGRLAKGMRLVNEVQRG